VPTIISLPANAGTAVQTIGHAEYHFAQRSPERLKRELRSTFSGWEFQPLLPTSLAASVELLSSFTAFKMLGIIICKKGMNVKGRARFAHFEFTLTSI
jgi:hypothetical protein